MEKYENRRSQYDHEMSYLSKVQCPKIGISNSYFCYVNLSHECINVDTLVSNQPDKHGNIAVIVVIDTFTRWIELYPIPDYTEQVSVSVSVINYCG